MIIHDLVITNTKFYVLSDDSMLNKLPIYILIKESTICTYVCLDASDFYGTNLYLGHYANEGHQ